MDFSLPDPPEVLSSIVHLYDLPDSYFASFSPLVPSFPLDKLRSLRKELISLEKTLQSSFDSFTTFFTKFHSDLDSFRKEDFLVELQKPLPQPEPEPSPPPPVVQLPKQSDIWNLSDFFFSAPLSKEELLNFFEKFSENIKCDFLLENLSKSGEHWTTRFQRAALNSKNSQKIEIPPKPHQSDSLQSKFWTKNSPFFPVEEYQKGDGNLIMGLTNALVRVDSVEEVDHLFVSVSYPIPKYDFENYFSLPLDVRVKCELESVKLMLKSEVNNEPFSLEIERCKCQIDRDVHGSIKEIREELIDRIEQIKEDQEKRKENIKMYLNLHKKSHK